MLHPSLFYENFCDKYVIDRMQYWDYLPNMLYVSSTYITKKLVGLPPIFLHTHMVHLYFDKIKYFDYLIKNRGTYSSIPA